MEYLRVNRTTGVRSPIVFFWITLAVISLVVCVLDYFIRPQGKDILVEAHGLIFDLLVLGVIFSIYEQSRNRNERIDRYFEELSIFSEWNDKEGIVRKVGIIKNLLLIRRGRLNLHYIRLNGSNLTDAKFPQTNFNHATFVDAIFINVEVVASTFVDANLFGLKSYNSRFDEADFTNAGLSESVFMQSNVMNATFNNSDLSFADLADAENVTIDQLLGAKCLYGAKLPDGYEAELTRRKPKLFIPKNHKSDSERDSEWFRRLISRSIKQNIRETVLYESD